MIQKIHPDEAKSWIGNHVAYVVKNQTLQGKITAYDEEKSEWQTTIEVEDRIGTKRKKTFNYVQICRARELYNNGEVSS